MKTIAIIMLMFIASVGMSGAASAINFGNIAINGNTVSGETINAPVSINFLSGNSIRSIKSENTFSPRIININRRSIGDISVRSRNTDISAFGSRHW